MQEKKPKEQQKIVKGLSNYARYSGLAFQMVAIILIGVFGGIKVDKWLSLKFPVFTVILSLLGTGIALYTGIKDLLRNK
ncbi:MAG TPA: AtpZ/AtpI family protein [Bacteroidales bacterium]|nr:AtpZ/AtpI family protein [Bacteroidales bacterium]